VSKVTEIDDGALTLLRMCEGEVLANPNELYRTLREYDPVHWDPYMHAWVVTTYPEVVTVLSTCSADRTPRPDALDRMGLSLMKPFSEMMLQQMMFMDGAAHSRLRGLCAAAFTPARVQRLRSLIESTANDLIDNVIADGSMDLVADFANPLPAILTAQLLGVPIADHRQLHAWVLDLAEVLGNFQHDPARLEQIVESVRGLEAYIARHMELQRTTPNDGLIQALMTAEVDGRRLSDEEVVANTIITLIGGHETTTNLIASGFLTLLGHPDSYELLRSHPEIAGSAVEELLRYESPVQHTARIAPSDIQLGGKTIRKGAHVVAALAAANRDPNRFPNPDTLDLMRTDNRHLAFGRAAHFCFGAPLARMEGQIAFNQLLNRLEEPRLLETRLEWRANAGLRSLIRLRIGFASQPPRGRTS
jgi:pimeloyl-[acyl-carrier protein] synthase